MNVELKNTDAVNAIITITVAKDDYAERVEKKLKEYRRKANIPGFRPGMVPMGMIKKMYGKAVTAEQVNELLGEQLYDYIKKENLDVLGDPLPNETEQPVVDFDSEEPLKFVFDVALAPDFDINLTKKDKIVYYDIKLSDEQVENQLKQIARQNGEFVVVDSAVEENDIVKIDAVEVGNEERKVEGEILSPAHLKDADQKALFVGRKAGDVVTFNPQKAMNNDYEVASFLHIARDEAKDITADFTATITEVKRHKDAELNEDLFKKIYPNDEIKDAAAFRAKVADDLKKSYTPDSDYRFGIDARNTLIKKLDGVVFPEAFLKRWVLATHKDINSQSLDESFGQMIDDLKWQLIKGKIATKDGIKVEEADVDDLATKFARMQWAQYGIANVPDDMLKTYIDNMKKDSKTMSRLAERAFELKVLDAIKAAVKLDNKEISLDDFQKLAD